MAKRNNKKEVNKTEKKNNKPLTLQECMEKAFCEKPKTYTEKMSEIFKNFRI